MEIVVVESGRSGTHGGLGQDLSELTLEFTEC